MRQIVDRGISIHALLAESDGIGLVFLWWGVRFLSTLSLRRATSLPATTPHWKIFLSTLSLRRATAPNRHPCRCNRRFLSTLSLRRATRFVTAFRGSVDRFLSTLSLRRATHTGSSWATWFPNFYPRSPCGERLVLRAINSSLVIFLSTLSLRRATPADLQIRGTLDISIHALLAESDNSIELAPAGIATFLSTLSLRRATGCEYIRQPAVDYFYPRSPCGERRDGFAHAVNLTGISIHALLAESDGALLGVVLIQQIFLSTLSLRRATHFAGPVPTYIIFLSTLSLRRATCWQDTRNYSTT